jgi:hypothetical protein
MVHIDLIVVLHGCLSCYRGPRCHDLQRIVAVAVAVVAA